MRTFCAMLMVAALSASGCGQNKTEQEGYGPGETEKWENPNFKVIGVGSYNYTDYDIYGVYLLPLDKNDIDFAATGIGRRATPAHAARWDGGYGGNAGLAWDLRWKSPKKFKVWWERIVDMDLYRKSGPYAKGGGLHDPYDPYTTKQTRPGLAWCEYEIEVKEKFGEAFGPPFPRRYRDQMVLYFFPDGTVEGHLEFAADSEIKKVDIAKRNELPVLKDRACLKEITNPYFGKKRPISIN
jgi:hypothetical protein